MKKVLLVLILLIIFSCVSCSTVEQTHTLIDIVGSSAVTVWILDLIFRNM